VIDGTMVGSLAESGLLVYLGVTHTDGPAEVDWMARKIWGLRILADEQSASDVGAPVLVVSQFTLYGDARKGNRPSYVEAAPADHAEPLYDRFCEKLGAKKGFGAHMDVASVNDGPFTVWLDR
jgi:D-tyrosyl-tRNA(Tyr) deacylase